MYLYIDIHIYIYIDIDIKIYTYITKLYHGPTGNFTPDSVITLPRRNSLMCHEFRNRLKN